MWGIVDRCSTSGSADGSQAKCETAASAKESSETGSTVVDPDFGSGPDEIQNPDSTVESFAFRNSKESRLSGGKEDPDGTRCEMYNADESLRNIAPGATSKADPPEYRCKLCDKAFDRASSLKQHGHIHGTVKTFRCSLCDRAYTQYSNLCRHWRNRHANENPGQGHGQGHGQGQGQTLLPRSPIDRVADPTDLTQSNSNTVQGYHHPSMYGFPFLPYYDPYLYYLRWRGGGLYGWPPQSAMTWDPAAVIRSSRAGSAFVPPSFHPEHPFGFYPDFASYPGSLVGSASNDQMDSSQASRKDDDDVTPVKRARDSCVITTGSGSSKRRKLDTPEVKGPTHLIAHLLSTKDDDDVSTGPPRDVKVEPPSSPETNPERSNAAVTPLSTHQQDHHECQFCSKTFPRLVNLTRHLRVHTGVQPYDCKDCGRRFNIASNMKRHVLKVHRK